MRRKNKKVHSGKRFFLLRPRFLLIAAALALSALALYLLVLDIKIRGKFESHRWNLPSRVYSDAFYLYPGQDISPSQVEQKLIRLFYKKSDGPVSDIGEYSRKGSKIKVYLHNFAYPSENFSGFLAELVFQGDRLDSITRDGEKLKTLKVEPELIASIFDDKMEDRTLARLEEIPDYLVRAVIAIEDERFYSHRGIDPIGIARAILTDIIHLKAAQGGSTITQQLVKNYFLTSEKTISRKLNEILMALLLERHYSKEEILEAYFNEIYFGQRGPVSVTGIEEASKLYFSKNASQLSLAEAALLAGLLRSPGEYSPFKNIIKAQERRNFVLKTLFEKDLITRDQYETARREKIILSPKNDRVFQASYFIDFVQRELRANYPAEVLKSQGLKIFTTLDMKLQQIAEDSVEKHLSKLEEDRLKLKNLKSQGKILQGILLTLQPQTGAIRAFVGGRNYGSSQFNRISEAHRQPGSAFKPFVYMTALNQGYTLASIVDDTSFSVRVGRKNWTPANYDHQERGSVTLRQALEESLNIATTRLAMDVGLDNVIDAARAAGIESPLEAYPSLALGAFEVTPLELARAYTIFPNQGMRSEPLAITSVVTRDGEVLERKRFKMKKVASPEVAYLINSALRGVLDRGTATSSRALGFTGLAAGKTGTTSDYRDSWFIGYTSDVLSVTWVGYDDGTTSGLSGASGALPIWTDFMKKLNPPGSFQVDFPATENIVLMQISKDGKLYQSGCGEPFEEAFINGTEPKTKCNDD